MRTDPSDNGVRPDRTTIERALRVAQALVDRPDDHTSGATYWRGAAEALRWSLGQRAETPVSARYIEADLDKPRRPLIEQESRYVYDVMRGARRTPGDTDIRYLTGAENTLCWVVSGHGFAQLLDPDWVWENLGIK